MFSSLPDLRMISDCGGLQILCLNGGEEWGSGPAGICGDLSGPAGICGLWGSVGICGDLQGSAGICLASHSETLCNLVVGPGVFPRPTAISPG